MSMLVFAHRGASGYAPENTFAAFDLAARMGADGVETDVRLTRDGVGVLLHDATLQRTTDGAGAIARRNWTDVERLDAGRWFGPSFAGQRMPRLDAFLDRYAGALRICLEVKAPRAVEPLVRLLRQRGLYDREDLEVTSFSRAVVLELRHALPDVAVGQITHFFFPAVIERAARDGARRIWTRASTLTPERLARSHARGLGVWAWGIHDRSLLQRAIELGADGVALDRPDWALTPDRSPRTDTPSGPAAL